MSHTSLGLIVASHMHHEQAAFLLLASFWLAVLAAAAGADTFFRKMSGLSQMQNPEGGPVILNRNPLYTFQEALAPTGPIESRREYDAGRHSLHKVPSASAQTSLAG